MFYAILLLHWNILIPPPLTAGFPALHYFYSNFDHRLLNSLPFHHHPASRRRWQHLRRSAIYPKNYTKTDIYIWGKVEQLVITNNNYTQLSWRLMRHVQPGFSSALIYTPIYTFCWMTIVKNSLVLNGNWWFGDPESNPCENTESNSWVFGGSYRWFLGYCLFWFLG